MSHAFSSSSQDPASQRLSAEEARELIRGYAEPVVSLESGFTVEDLAETLNISNQEAQEMVRNLRARQRMPQPMSNVEWLKKRLWIWVLLAVIGIAIAGGGLMSSIAYKVTNIGNPPVNRTEGDGIYSSRVAAAGRALGMTAPPGFSYRLQYEAVDAGVNGDSKNYIDVPDLSPPNVAILQAQIAENMMAALNAAIEKNPPNWVNGKAPAVLIPNYYEGGDGVSFDVTLSKDAFPYKAETESAQRMKLQVLEGLQRVWDETID